MALRTDACHISAISGRQRIALQWLLPIARNDSVDLDHTSDRCDYCSYRLIGGALFQVPPGRFADGGARAEVVTSTSKQLPLFRQSRDRSACPCLCTNRVQHNNNRRWRVGADATICPITLTTCNLATRDDDAVRSDLTVTPILNYCESPCC